MSRSYCVCSTCRVTCRIQLWSGVRMRIAVRSDRNSFRTDKRDSVLYCDLDTGPRCAKTRLQVTMVTRRTKDLTSHGYKNTQVHEVGHAPVKHTSSTLLWRLRLVKEEPEGHSHLAQRSRTHVAPVGHWADRRQEWNSKKAQQKGRSRPESRKKYSLRVCYRENLQK